ncbi:MAG TPA: hypothetical protein DIV86_01060, partial [Alphaproteobacteria bacterium]|nr:hypothetical protein [Alphaproteobacteria bacterium]
MKEKTLILNCNSYISYLSNEKILDIMKGFSANAECELDYACLPFYFKNYPEFEECLTALKFMDFKTQPHKLVCLDLFACMAENENKILVNFCSDYSQL